MRALVLLACLTGSGLAADPPKKNTFGDPLPEGALLRFGTVRARAPISSFGIQKDGTVVTVSGASDGVAVRVWEPTARDPKPPRLLPLDEPLSWGLPQVSADGHYVAAGTKNKLIVWDAETAKRVAAFEIDRLKDFTFAPNGKSLVAATETDTEHPNTELHLCDIATGKTRKADDHKGSKVFPLVFSGDGKRLVAVANAELCVWDTATGKRLASNYPNGYPYLARPITNRTGDTVICWNLDTRKLVALDALTAKPRPEVKLPPKGTWAVFTADDKVLLVGQTSRALLWDHSAGQALRAFPGPAGADNVLTPAPARISGDGKLLAFANLSLLMRWNGETGAPLFAEQNVGHVEHVKGITASPDGKRIATCGYDNRLIVWDATTGKEVWRAESLWARNANADFSPDGKFLYAAGPKPHEAVKYDAATGKAVLTFSVDRYKGAMEWLSFESLRLAPDGKALFAVSDAIELRPVLVAWDTATGNKLSARMIEFSNNASALAVSPDGEHVAAMFPDSGVFAVGAPKKSLLKDANDGVGLESSGAFSNDGKWLVQAGASRSGTGDAVAVVSTANWKVVCRVPTRVSAGAAVSEDGKTLAVADGEDVILYEVATAKKLGAVRMPPGAWASRGPHRVTALRFTADGTKLITGHADTTALVWPVPARAK